MSQPSIPPAAESPPIVAALLRGGLGFVVAYLGSAGLVAVVGLGLLGSTYDPTPDPNAGLAYLGAMAGLFLLVLLGAQGPAYLGLLVSADAVTVLVSAVAAFAAVYAGHEVAFAAGGPRLPRQTAVGYGALVSIGWVLLSVLVYLSIVYGLSTPIALLGEVLRTLAILVVGSAVFSAVFGGMGGLLANR